MIVFKFLYNLLTTIASLGDLFAFAFFFPVFKEVTKSDPVFFWAMTVLVLVAAVGGAAVLTFSGKQ